MMENAYTSGRSRLVGGVQNRSFDRSSECEQERSVGQITVFSGPERRRHWTDEQRLRIVTEAVQKEAVTNIERANLEAQSEVMISGLETDAAKLFLSHRKSIDELMPSIGVADVKPLLGARAAR